MKPIWWWPLATHGITIYHSYPARVASISPGYFHLLIYYCYDLSLTPLFSGDQITTPNLVNSSQAAHNGGSAGSNYRIAQHTSHLSLSSLIIVIDQGRWCAAPVLSLLHAHTIIFQPEKTCPQNFNNENILTVKCSTDPRWGHLTFPTSNKEKTKTKVTQGLKELPNDLSWWCRCAL